MLLYVACHGLLFASRHLVQATSDRHVWAHPIDAGHGMALLREHHDWESLLWHAKQCSNPECGCALYIKKWDIWKHRLPIDTSNGSGKNQQTWLWHNLYDKNTQFQWACIVCDANRVDGKPLDRSSSVQLCNLLQHANGEVHKKKVSATFGIQYTPRTSMLLAPPIPLFKELMHEFQLGSTPTSGYSLAHGIVSKEKAFTMLWCCGEARAELRREHIQEADTMSIARDEAHGVLHLRYGCAGESLELHKGYLGQIRRFNCDAIGLTAATKDVYKQCCTQFLSPPKGAAVSESFSEQLYNHMCIITEAIAIDSADNEVVAASDMSWADDFTPNCKHILRDAAHSARRLLSRLFKADPDMWDIMGMFCHWPDSPAQMIEHSSQFNNLYEECCEQSEDAAVKTCFKNMRAAKHRIETFTTPLSRCILDPTALIAFAVKVTVIRRGERQGRAMMSFLTALCVHVLLLSAMMADASLEVLMFIRGVDTEQLDLTTLCQRVKNFLDRITWLFHNNGVLTVDGHTSFMLSWLKKPHFYMVGDDGRCIGGSRIPDNIINECLSHLRAWSLLAHDCCNAEFPSFSLVIAFSAFSLPKTLRTASCHFQAATLEKLQRLAKTFNLPHLVEEYKDHMMYAHAAYKESSFKCSFWDAWRGCIEKTQLIRDGPLMHPCSQLKHVLKRGLHFAPVTSGVEQSFAIVLRNIGPQRFGNLGRSTSESQMVGLVLTQFDGVDLDDLADRAQQIWIKAFPTTGSRTHTNNRIDSGYRTIFAQLNAPPSQPLAAGQLVDETQFRKRFTEQVAAAAPSGGSDILTSGHAELWTDRHEKEKSFQVAKMQKRKLEAIIECVCVCVFCFQ